MRGAPGGYRGSAELSLGSSTPHAPLRKLRGRADLIASRIPPGRVTGSWRGPGGHGGVQGVLGVLGGSLGALGDLKGGEGELTNGQGTSRDFRETSRGLQGDIGEALLGPPPPLGGGP